ncbi:carboxymuconolactone decarboxylase family protein [Streptomyces sp. NPDC020845]|uniref:carboxymuconolactone decarboxylase family protein n=1 Tax=Streptomyces sp. NPDC020845 TaxID=3365096 RepID=UPI00378E332A
MTTTNKTPETPETAQSTHDHGPRMRLANLAPEFYKAMVGLDAAARKGLDPALVDLIKIRASQINHCAFCIHMHTRDARKAGETEERINLLSAWEEASGFFTEKERAALALTEAVTVLTDGFVPDEVYQRAAAHFEEAELAQVIAAIIAINAWNRIGVSTRMVPGKA